MNRTGLGRHGRHTGLLIVLAALLATSWKATAPAPVANADGTTFNVNTTVDAVDANLGDRKCLTAAGTCSLRAAIMEANAERFAASVPAPFTINLTAGQVYTLTILGADEDEAASGDLDIRVPMRILSSGSALIQATSSSWRDRIFEVNSDLIDGEVSLTGLSIRGGHLPPASGSVLAKGGGIYAHGLAHGSTQNVLRLVRCEVTKNAADTGGGIAVEDSDAGNLNNTVAELVLDGTTVSDNTAANGDGGGLLLNNAGPVSLVLSKVQDNTASKDGGGIWREFGVGSLKLSESTVSGNTSQGNGGGIFNLLTTSLLQSTVSENTSKGNGGGIDNGYMLTLTESTISGNTSQGTGGGILNGGTATVTNSTISGNSATAAGGGVQNTSTLTLNNVTVAANKAATGGGVANQSGATVNLANTIVGTNTSTSSGADCSGSLNSQGHNLIGAGSSCTLAGTTTGNILNQDPRLGALQDNGGKTKTQALLGTTFMTGTCSFGPCITTLPASPAIDFGSAATPGSTTAGACALTDQRGTTRPLDGDGDRKVICDIGAYEAPVGTVLGDFTVTPRDAIADVDAHDPTIFSWTVPTGLGWRSLDTLDLLLRGGQGTALWLRFHEVTGDAGTISLVNPDDFTEGPAFAPGTDSQLDAGAVTVQLATSTVDGPPGQTVSLNLDLQFRQPAAGRTFNLLVLAVGDNGDYQGLSPAGTVTVQGAES